MNIQTKKNRNLAKNIGIHCVEYWNPLRLGPAINLILHACQLHVFSYRICEVKYI